MTRRCALTLLGWLIAHSASAQTFVVPNAPDLMLKTRRAHEGRGASSMVEVLYIKGARQRREMIFESAGRGRQRWIHITQCDEHRVLLLNDEAKTYGYEPIEGPSVLTVSLRPMSPAGPRTGPILTITIDSVDTGDRRPFGHYPARHVVTTRTTDRGVAGIPIATSERDGWYVDVPDAGCWAPSIDAELVASDTDERTHIEHRGTARRGYAIEETIRDATEPHTIFAKLELIDSSEAPLDDALFTVPPGYRAALPMPYGGYDLSKPDTLMNRLTVYRDFVVSWTYSLFRSRGY